MVVPFTYETLSFAFGENYIARREGRYGVINLENEIILDFLYLAMVHIEEGGVIKADITEFESVIIDDNFVERLTRNSCRIEYRQRIYKNAY